MASGLFIVTNGTEVYPYSTSELPHKEIAPSTIHISNNFMSYTFVLGANDKISSVFKERLQIQTSGPEQKLYKKCSQKEAPLKLIVYDEAFYKLVLKKV